MVDDESGASRLNIYVRNRDGSTESMYAASRGGKVVFHNTDCEHELVVTIERIDQERPQHENGCGPQERIVVRPKDKVEFPISPETPEGTKYKYTARIGESKPEDPIIYVPGRR